MEQSEFSYSSLNCKNNVRSGYKLQRQNKECHAFSKRQFSANSLKTDSQTLSKTDINYWLVLAELHLFVCS